MVLPGVERGRRYTVPAVLEFSLVSFKTEGCSRLRDRYERACVDLRAKFSMTRCGQLERTSVGDHVGRDGILPPGEGRLRRRIHPVVGRSGSFCLY